MINRSRRPFSSIGPATLVARTRAVHLATAVADKPSPAGDSDPQQAPEQTHDHARDTFRGRISR